MSASAHGGVRPWWLQGSRETYTVAPSTDSFAAASARASACGSPARSCQPSAITRPSFTITQPTLGLGVDVLRPRSVSARARTMKP